MLFYVETVSLMLTHLSIWVHHFTGLGIVQAETFSVVAFSKCISFMLGEYSHVY